MLKALLHTPCQDSLNFLNKLYHSDDASCHTSLSDKVKKAEEIISNLLSDKLIKPYEKETFSGEVTLSYTLTQKGLAHIQAKSEIDLSKSTSADDMCWEPEISAASPRNLPKVGIAAKYQPYVTFSEISIEGKLNPYSKPFTMATARVARLNVFDAMIASEFKPEELMRSSMDTIPHLEALSNHDLDGDCAMSIFEISEMLLGEQNEKHRDIFIIDKIKLNPALIGKGIGKKALQVVESAIKLNNVSGIVIISAEALGHNHCLETKQMFSRKIKKSYLSIGFQEHPFSERYMIKEI